jgi:hypothetical protein
VFDDGPLKAAGSSQLSRTSCAVPSYLRFDFRFIGAQAKEKVAEPSAGGDQQELWKP